MHLDLQHMCSGWRHTWNLVFRCDWSHRKGVTTRDAVLKPQEKWRETPESTEPRLEGAGICTWHYYSIHIHIASKAGPPPKITLGNWFLVKKTKTALWTPETAPFSWGGFHDKKTWTTYWSWLVNLTPPGHLPHLENKGLIAGLIMGNQWVFISRDHEAGYFWGSGTLRG